MLAHSSTNDNDQILAAALSSILGKQILSESSVSKQTEQNVSKISLFDQHLISFMYGQVGIDDLTNNESFMTLHITILTTKTIFSCIIERDASVDKLKQIIYERQGILCNKQNLVYSGQEIDESHLLSEYGIQDSSTIYVVRFRSINADDVLVLDGESRDQQYDYDFTNIKDEGKQFIRGGDEYRRPCGWERFAIRVIGKYEDEVWLSSNNNPDEWPVSYHGTGRNAAKTIAQTGYDLTKHTRFAYGHGIYSTPDINVAKKYATSFTLNGQEYLVILQNRINPKNVTKLSRAETGVGEYWISRTASDIRPYGWCIMKKS